MVKASLGSEPIVLSTGIWETSASALFFFVKKETYGDRVRRPDLQTRSFKSILKPCPEIALDIRDHVRLGLIEIIIHRPQLGQGGERIGRNCNVSWNL